MSKKALLGLVLVFLVATLPLSSVFAVAADGTLRHSDAKAFLPAFVLPDSVSIGSSPATAVGEIISSNTAWTVSDSPYIHSSSILVSSEVTLTMKPRGSSQIQLVEFVPQRFL